MCVLIPISVGKQVGIMSTFVPSATCNIEGTTVSFKKTMTMDQVVLFLVLSSKWVFGFYEPTMVVPGVGCGTTKEYSTWKNVLPEAKYPPCALLKSQQAREAYKDVIPSGFSISVW